MSVFNYTMYDMMTSSYVTLALGFGLLILIALIATSATPTTLNARRAEAAVQKTAEKAAEKKIEKPVMNPLSKRAAPAIIKHVPAPRMEPKSIELPVVVEAPVVVLAEKPVEVVAEVIEVVQPVQVVQPEVSLPEVSLPEVSLPEVSLPEVVEEAIVPEPVAAPKSALDATFDAYRAAMKASSLEARGMSIAQKMPSLPRSGLRSSFQGKAADFLESMNQSIDERLVAQFDNGL